MSNHKRQTTTAIWSEQLNVHIDKLRDNTDFVTRFSLHETLQTSWDNIKALPSDWLGNDKDPQTGRNPVPVDLVDSVHPCEFSQRVRYVGNEVLALDFHDQPINVLTVSSGGAKGAYGAGLVSGWAEKGDMPEFELMMGVSTGAIITLFTFIGKTEELYSFYNDYRSDDLLEKQVIQGLMSGSAIYDNQKFIRLLQHYIDDVVIKRLADEAQKGRVLLIGTTNLDRSLPVTWDLTAIAASNSPFARQLIADVVLASCAIPVAFPPVLMPVVDNNGREYDELHVDGAASLQLLIDVPVKNANIYAIVNKSLQPTYRPTALEVLAIGNQSLSSALTNAIVGDMYRLYAAAQHNDNAFYATWIPETFTAMPRELFDRHYMQQLFALGHECALLGQVWHRRPPP